MSSSIVTIQLGNYANFVGSHYWNIHEYSLNNNDNSLDPDIHYCEGLTTNNVVTYTPRLISMDWKENLGANVIDDIYDEIENEGKVNVESRRDYESLKVLSYSGKVDKHTGFTNDELNINKKGKIVNQTNYTYWNEFLYSRYHPNSLNALPKLHRGLDKDNFKCFSQGVELANNCDFLNKMEEQCHYFVEKCDSLQGFQLLCDGDGGFGGVASTWLDYIHDEYRKPVLSMPLTDSPIKSVESIFNMISLFTSLNSASVVTLPLSLLGPDHLSRKFSNVEYDNQLKYHTSSILALAIKSLLLPCVLKEQMYQLSDFGSLVSGRGNSLVSLALSMPLPLQEGKSLCTILGSNSPHRLFTNLNPFASSVKNVETAIGNIYGVPASRLITTEQRCQSLFRNCSSICDTMELYISENFRPNNVKFFNIPSSVRLSEPFPAIFSSEINRMTGEILTPVPQSNDPKSFICPNKVPLSTMLFTDDTCDNLIPIYDKAKEALRRNKLNDILSSNERDSLVEVLENFRNLL